MSDVHGCCHGCGKVQILVHELRFYEPPREEPETRLPFCTLRFCLACAEGSIHIWLDKCHVNPVLLPS